MSKTLPHDAFGLIPGLRDARAKTGALLVGLDFDGTLAHIVPTPAEASLLDGAADVLDALARRSDSVVAIVTGRGVGDARARVGMDALHYAGNHGLEIEGPGLQWLHPGATAARPFLDALLELLHESVGRMPGVILEDKLVSMSVHFRTIADPAMDEEIVRLVHTAAARVGGPIRLTDGKKVVEVRPDVEWDKGRAFVYLRDALVTPDAPAIFIGDDRTDEDAFRELRDPPDAGIIVGTARLGDTRATAVLEDPESVIRFLARLTA